MEKYYTRACNFFYGSVSKKFNKKKITIPVCGDNSISFNQVEIFTRDKKKIKTKIINIKDVKKLPPIIKKKIFEDIDKIKTKREIFREKRPFNYGNS